MSERTEPPEAAAPTPEQISGQARQQVLADAVAALVFALALLGAQSFADVARWFPTAISLTGLVVCAGKLVFDIRRWRSVQAWLRYPSDSDGAPRQIHRELSEEVEPLTREGRRELLIWVGMIVALLVAIRVIGMVPAAALWLPATLWLRGKRSWVLVACSAVGVVIVLLLLESQLGVRWPEAYVDVLELLR